MGWGLDAGIDLMLIKNPVSKPKSINQSLY
jgi:hypothetical protein